MKAVETWLRYVAASLVVAGVIAAVILTRSLGTRPQSTPSGPIAEMPSLAPAPSPLASSSEPLPTSAPTATPTSSPTPVPNLFAMANGAFIRRWQARAFAESPSALLKDGAINVLEGWTQPSDFVIELPNTAQIDSVAIRLQSTKPVRVQIETGNDIGRLTPAGTIDYTSASTDKPLSVAIGKPLRYARFILTRTQKATLLIEGLVALGRAGPPEAGSLVGTWVSVDGLLDASGHPLGFIPNVVPKNDHTDPSMTYVRDGALTMFNCASRSPVWHGALQGPGAVRDADRVQLTGNGKLLVAHLGNAYFLGARGDDDACHSNVAGTGPKVTAFVRLTVDQTPELNPTTIGGYRYERRFASLLSPAQFAGSQFVMLDGFCDAEHDLTRSQQNALLTWVAQGHKLIIRDADICDSSDYSFVPYAFTTSASGRGGARSDVLEIVDPSSLGQRSGDPARVMNTLAYLKNKDQQLGDSDVMKTVDPHWCGHMLSKNRVGEFGWVHAYARYGRGLIIYDGFDRDDVNSAIPEAVRLTKLEYAQPVGGELPCNAHVASQLVLTPSVDRTLPDGRAVKMRFPMSLFADASARVDQDVALTIVGGDHERAAVEPQHLRVRAGGQARLTATVELRSGWTGRHAVTVTATTQSGQSAQASIVLGRVEQLGDAFKTQRRVRIYGIHFDVNSADIQPRSQATIAQIAAVLQAHRDWKLRVEGYTDSEGGASYNRGLSIRRADAVVADLVVHFHIARDRLSAAGFGLDHPVASNANEAGKALNRRVELVRL